MQSFQKNVPVLVFEDAYLSAELGAVLPTGLTEGGQAYTFDWHPVYNAIGGRRVQQQPAVLIRNVEEYRAAFDFLHNKLRDEAILFLDLEFLEPTGSRKFLIGADEISDDLFTFMKCYAGVESVEDGLGYFNPKRLGLLLAFAAARNQNWRGVITFQSRQDVVDLDHLRTCLGADDRIQWFDLRQTLKDGGTSPDVRAGFVKAAIDAFLEPYKGPPLWPQYTNGWFSDGQPHHELHKLTQEGVEEIKKYLCQLLPNFDVPPEWFTDPNFYNVLKGLIGVFSVSAGYSAKDRKNLRLGALPLLLAAQMRPKGADIGWLASFEWDIAATFEVMKHDRKDEAQTAVRAAASFLEQFAFRANGSSQVLRAHWGCVPNDQTKHLWIDFDFNPLSRAGERSLLQTLFGAQWGHGKGQTITAYWKMMESARTTSGRVGNPSFSLCIYPVEEMGRTITRLDFRNL